MEEEEIMESLQWNLRTIEIQLLKSIQDSIHQEVERTLKNSLIDVLNLESEVKKHRNLKDNEVEETRIVTARNEYSKTLKE